MKETKITTGYSRELAVTPSSFDVNLHVKCTDRTYSHDGEVYTSLTHEEAAQLAAALLGENATVITDLPEVTVSLLPFDTRKVARAGDTSYYIDRDPESILTHAKELLAIHAVLVKCNAEKEAAKKAEAEAVKAKEATRDKRREELRREFGAATFHTLTAVARTAIDRIIDLEEAAKVS